MSRVLMSVLIVLLISPGLAFTQIGTAFTYQGRLADGGLPAGGLYDFQLILYDAPAGGSQVGSILTQQDVVVASGLFTVNLDFGGVFSGAVRWLEIAVRPGASTGVFSVLSPRQELKPTPNALFAANAATVAGLTCTNNQVPKWSGVTWICGTDDDTTPPSASAPISIAANTIALTNCGPNQLYKMNGGGTAWACGSDVDTNTTYTAGTGLTLIGTAFQVNDTLVARKDAAAGNQAFNTDTLFLNYTNGRVGIGTASPSGILSVNGGTASTDTSGLSINLNSENGGVDGADANTTGGGGGEIVLTPGTGGTSTNAGAIRLTGAPGGSGTVSSAGEGSDIFLLGGIGGIGNGTTGGSGGDITIAAGTGAAGTQSGLGGDIAINGGFSATNVGGDVSISAGDSQSAAGGEITLHPGSGGSDGSIELGGVTSNNNSTTSGAIKVHIVSGDMNFTGFGDGIILRSPNGAVCRLLSINDSGALITTAVICP